MPLFDLRCEKCGSITRDVYFSHSKPRDSVFRCGCGSTHYEKLPPKVNARFKGSGFYETDYKKGSTEG